MKKEFKDIYLQRCNTSQNLSDDFNYYRMYFNNNVNIKRGDFVGLFRLTKPFIFKVTNFLYMPIIYQYLHQPVIILELFPVLYDDGILHLLDKTTYQNINPLDVIPIFPHELTSSVTTNELMKILTDTESIETYTVSLNGRAMSWLS